MLGATEKYPSCLDADPIETTTAISSSSSRTTRRAPLPEQSKAINFTQDAVPHAQDATPSVMSPQRQPSMSKRRTGESTSSMQTAQTKVSSPASAAAAPESAQLSLEDRRTYLTSIPPANWATFMRWCQHRPNPDSKSLAILAKIDHQIELTDDDVESLWNLRLKSIRRGFPASILSPR
ncbi:hypothetical protein GSD1FS_1846 [Bifidobacterium sp. GSD1FS]|uniref:Uncharacterized protein n=1 Tax=Bifidobacterium canis TaxID=2610880 RepID=A0A7K1J7M0_9BIFI|nr:hypothetical protein [Bifidobacterium canis]